MARSSRTRAGLAGLGACSRRTAPRRSMNCSGRCSKKPRSAERVATAAKAAWMGWGAACALSVALPAAALLLYLAGRRSACRRDASAGRRGKRARIERRGKTSKARSAAWPCACGRSPTTCEGWMVLARSYELLRALRRCGGRVREGPRAGAERARSCSPTTPMPWDRRATATWAALRRRPSMPRWPSMRSIPRRWRWPAWPRSGKGTMRWRDCIGNAAWQCCHPAPKRPRRSRPISPS